jgi:hypothetical protein
MSLNNLADANSLKYYTLVNDVVTRWNSSYLMINFFIKNENLLKLFSKTNILVEQEWIEIKNIRSLLEPFYELTRIVSTYPTIGLCYTMALKIQKYNKIWKTRQV